jgi:hypothetical protein
MEVGKKGKTKIKCKRACWIFIVFCSYNFYRTAFI